MKTVGVELVTSNAYARGFAEGVADYALTKSDWQLRSISQDSLTTANIGNFDGIILRLLNDRIEKLAKSAGVRIVDIYGDHPRPGIAQILTDNATIGNMAADFFLKRGYVNFGWCGIAGISFSDEPGAAYTQRLTASGHAVHRYECSPELYERIADGVPERCPDSKRLARWLKAIPKPAAIFCCNDHRAFQVMSVARMIGIAIPEEISILGIDNDTLLCSFTPVALSSIDPDAKRLGFAAARLLDATLKNPPCNRLHRPLRIPPRKLVERESTAYIPQSSKWLSEALLYIEKHLASGISTRDIVRLSGKSSTFVERIFKKKFGTSVQRYIMFCRIHKAQDLLQEGSLLVKQIAAECGYKSVQYFCRDFKSATGHSPKCARNKMPRPSSSRKSA